jgi:fructosamine-3-kinase
MSDTADLVGWMKSAMGAGVVATARLGGGDVADAYRVELDDGRTVFAKTPRAPPPHFFSTEASGLSWLRAGATVTRPKVTAPEVTAPHVMVPEVLAVSDGGAGMPCALVLEWVEEGRSHRTTEADLGRALAGLHRSGAPCFGREDRRTTGSRGLPNEPLATWTEFYATQRVLPLARLARDAGALPPRVISQLERIAGRLDELGGPAEPPARLHGDLWAGNRLVDAHGRSWLIDPAAHGGHREFDLAMMRLFGGFGAECFDAYHEAAPLADGWHQRIALHQLAPLTVHAIKFGGGYVAATERAVSSLS